MPGVARKGDTVLTGHACSFTTPTLQCSTNVLVNKKGACRLGDMLQPHTILAGVTCIPHVAVINAGAPTVFVNGRPIARITDSADLGVIITGSGNVIVG